MLLNDSGFLFFMPRIEKNIQIKNPQGLHARPAAMFVQIASKYNSSITIQKGDEKVNGRSIMGILTLGAQQNCMVKLIVDGTDAEEATQELETLLNREKME